MKEIKQPTSQNAASSKAASFTIGTPVAAIIALAILAVLAAGVYLALPFLSGGSASPQAAGTLPPEVSSSAGASGADAVSFKDVEETPVSSVDEVSLEEALAHNGIPDAVVEIQPGRILVAFKLASGVDRDASAFFALGLVAPFANPSDELMVEVQSDAGARTYSAKASDVQDYLDGKLTEEQFEAAVKAR